MSVNKDNIGIFSRFYHWMLCNLPSRLMYKKIYIDNMHEMYMPRFGFSKKQLIDSEKKADELLKNIKYD